MHSRLRSYLVGACEECLHIGKRGIEGQIAGRHEDESLERTGHPHDGFGDGLAYQSGRSAKHGLDHIHIACKYVMLFIQSSHLSQ